MIPDDLLYTDQHEWIKVEGKVGTVGITDYAQDALGDVTFVELPEVGKEVAQGQETAVVESTKAAADIYSPAGGRITEVNSDLENDPSLVNSDPYGQGWIFKIELQDTGGLKKLMKADRYAELTAGEQ